LKFNFNDYSLWERYRGTVEHPATLIKRKNLEIAWRNLKRHAWAREYLFNLKLEVDFVLDKPQKYFMDMIPETTPGTVLFTMCPVCEVAPIHGYYEWNPKNPDQLRCIKCGTVYPNDKYPEDMVLRSRYRPGQTFTYYGGKYWSWPGSMTNIHPIRSSWTGNIRARKVKFMARLARDLAITYALTQESIYAEKVKMILLRFADVYPNYLVHSGYGEYADMNPKIASANIVNLPEDELDLPPNKPDRRLTTGYWTAGRATASGLEGHLIKNLTLAYDLIFEATDKKGASLLSEGEKQKIEKDLLLEGTILLLCDRKFNNKSVTNRAAVALVGVCVGDPLRVRFGLKGFRHFVDKWFLPDGAPSESLGYALMTLGGLFDLGNVLQGYSDPPGFSFQGRRLEKLSILSDSKYRAIFSALYNSLLPNLRYPALADSYSTTTLRPYYAEFMYNQYHDPRYLTLLRELTAIYKTKRYKRSRVSVAILSHILERGGDGEYALFHRDADLKEAGEALTFESLFFPAWKVGYLRTGKDGCESVAILSLSEWGGHHHRDHLNLFYFKEGWEVLSDLGYLCDRPPSDKVMTSGTAAHNLVVVDGMEQIAEGRNGSILLFDITDRVKVMEASSKAYPQATLYRRLCVVVDHTPENSYLLDIFWVVGGSKHDYIFHGPTEDYQVNRLPLILVEPAWSNTYGLTNLKEGETEEFWQATWKSSREIKFTATSLPLDSERVFIGDGWGMREARWGEYVDEKLPYVVRRREGNELRSCFITVFEVYKGDKQLVKGIKKVKVDPEEDAVAVQVKTSQGSDYIISSLTGKPRVVQTEDGTLETDGNLCILSEKGGKLSFLYLAGGRKAKWGGYTLKIDAPHLDGRVKYVRNGDADSYIVVDMGDIFTAYPIKKVVTNKEGSWVYVKRNWEGFDVCGGKTWKIIQTKLLMKKDQQKC